MRSVSRPRLVLLISWIVLVEYAVSAQASSDGTTKPKSKAPPAVYVWPSEVPYETTVSSSEAKASSSKISTTLLSKILTSEATSNPGATPDAASTALPTEDGDATVGYSTITVSGTLASRTSSTTEPLVKQKAVSEEETLSKKVEEAVETSTVANGIQGKKSSSVGVRKAIPVGDTLKLLRTSTVGHRTVSNGAMTNKEGGRSSTSAPAVDESVKLLRKEEIDSWTNEDVVRVVKKDQHQPLPKVKHENVSEVGETFELSSPPAETKPDDDDGKQRFHEISAPPESSTAATYASSPSQTFLPNSLGASSSDTLQAFPSPSTSAIKIAKKSYSAPPKPLHQSSTPVSQTYPLRRPLHDLVVAKENPNDKETSVDSEGTTHGGVDTQEATQQGVTEPSFNTTLDLPKTEAEPKTASAKDVPTNRSRLLEPRLSEGETEDTSHKFPLPMSSPEPVLSTVPLPSLEPSLSDISRDDELADIEKEVDSLSVMQFPDELTPKQPPGPDLQANFSSPKLSEPPDWSGDDNDRHPGDEEKRKKQRERLQPLMIPKDSVKEYFLPASTVASSTPQTSTTATSETPVVTTSSAAESAPSPGGCLVFDTGCGVGSTSPTTKVESDVRPSPTPNYTDPVFEETNVALCITVTLSNTWAQFCSQKEQFRHGVAEVLSSELRTSVRPRQVVIENRCERMQRNHHVTENDTVVVRMHLMDDQNRYSQKLTVLAAVILHHNDEGKVNLQMMNVCFYSRQHGSPSVLPHDSRVYSPGATSVIASITISAIAGTSLFLICILLVVMRQRLLNKRSPPPTVDGVSLASFKSSFRKKTIRQSLRSFLNDAFDGQEDLSHPVQFNNLPLVISNKEALEEEFKRIPMTMPRVDEVPRGAEGKNRYANVIPVPETRVHLTKKLGDETSDYINANFVRGYKGKSRSYIACQAPLPETVQDFWRLIWEQQCKVVIMLTACEENGVQRCAPYFPQNTLDCHKLYGDYQVSLQAKDVRPSFTISTFKLHDLDKNLCRDVHHCWFTAWPPQGVPEDVSGVVSFLIEARRYMARNSGPTVVHCSPGTGRTGTVLAVDMCMQELEDKRRVDVPRTVFKLRQDRSGSVQTKEQYAFIYEALYDYSARLAMQSSQRPSVVSTA